MGNMFSGPSIKTDPDQKRLAEEQRRENERLKAQEEQRRDALRRARSGRRSLISGDERGVRDTLG